MTDYIPNYEIEHKIMQYLINETACEEIDIRNLTSEKIRGRIKELFPDVQESRINRIINKLKKEEITEFDSGITFLIPDEYFNDEKRKQFSLQMPNLWIATYVYGLLVLLLVLLFTPYKTIFLTIINQTAPAEYVVINAVFIGSILSLSFGWIIYQFISLTKRLPYGFESILKDRVSISILIVVIIPLILYILQIIDSSTAVTIETAVAVLYTILGEKIKGVINKIKNK